MSGDVSEQPPRRVAVEAARRTPDGANVVRYDGSEVDLNPTALALWDLCDGRTTVEEMVEAVCVLFDITPDQARQDVERGLAQLRTAGLIR